MNNEHGSSLSVNLDCLILSTWSRFCLPYTTTSPYCCHSPVTSRVVPVTSTLASDREAVAVSARSRIGTAAAAARAKPAARAAPAAGGVKSRLSRPAAAAAAAGGQRVGTLGEAGGVKARLGAGAGSVRSRLGDVSR